MGRGCCSEMAVPQRKGPWTAEEDELLMKYIHTHGEGPWNSLPHRAGLLRCGKSCRLRWMNYLRPNIRRGNITPDEDDIIIRLHTLLAKRWSLIAGRLPGRTDNEIKNYWNTHLSKKMKVLRPLVPPQLPFRHGKNDRPDLKFGNKGNTNDKNTVSAAVHVYDNNNEPKYKNIVESTERVKIFTPKPIRISATSSGSKLVQPIRITASYSSKTGMHASNITCATGTASKNSSSENCKIIETYQNFFDNNEDVTEEKYHGHVICTDCLGIDDGCLKDVPRQGNTENLVKNEPRTLEMVYEEYLQLLQRRD